MKPYIIPSIQVQSITAVTILCGSKRMNSSVGIYGGDRSASASGGY